ncbi:MAG: protein kinase [Nitrospirota bacterium]
MTDKKLVKCRVCKWENSPEYPFCEMCGNTFEEKLPLGSYYQLERRIKREDILIGIKYLAQDKVNERKVVVYIFPDYLYGSEITETIRGWYKSVMPLQDERIVRVFGFFDDFSRRCRYLVKEYVEEWTTLRDALRKCISQGSRFREDDIIEYASEICKGIAHAHSKYILHLDLRPENIIVTPDNRIKINNFRLALLVKRKGLWQLPRSFRQYEVTEPVQRSDIYQFGMVLYEMINLSPFDPEKGDLFPDDLDKDIIELIKKMMDRSPSTRYFNITDVGMALEELENKMKHPYQSIGTNDDENQIPPNPPLAKGGRGDFQKKEKEKRKIEEILSEEILSEEENLLKDIVPVKRRDYGKRKKGKKRDRQR